MCVFVTKVRNLGRHEDNRIVSPLTKDSKVLCEVRLLKETD